MHDNALSAGDLRVLDGDDIEYRGQRFRLAGYDAPEVEAPRSAINVELERWRGRLARVRLETLVASARSVHLIDWQLPIQRGSRTLGTLLLDGRDVREIALREGWGVDYRSRNAIDWGDSRLPFYGMRSQ